MASEHFEVILADDDMGKRLHYQLRYKVFCVETGYEDPHAFPNQQERDEWDNDATHFLVRERHSGAWVAAMRLVLPGPYCLPVETLAEVEAESRPKRYAELSRLCMVGHYRRRLQSQALLLGEAGGAPGQQHTELKRRLRTTEILSILLDAAVSCSREHNIHHWYILTTKSLAKVCSQALPMRFKQVGPMCLHRGERYPYLVDVDEIYNATRLSACKDLCRSSELTKTAAYLSGKAAAV